MEFEFWHYWILAAFIFFILEVFIPGFILGSIGLGCIVAGLGAAFNLPLWLNIILAIAGFYVGISMLKPLLKRMENPSRVKTNAEGLIGKIGKVSERIDPIIGSGRVHIDGDEWKAVSVGNVPIAPGTIVEIIALESIIVTVRKVDYNENTKDIPAPSVSKSLSENKGLIISIGNKKEVVHHEEIFCFYSNQKISYLITTEGKQKVIDESLEKLEERLGSAVFFRANRQFIITAKVVKEFRADSSGKLDIFLQPSPNLPTSISVSRLKSHSFRKWLEKQV